jgi:hypothetical protein
MSFDQPQTLDKIAPLLAFGGAAVYAAVVAGFEIKGGQQAET